MEAERRVGVAVDFSDCSKKALRWAIDNIARKGDHLILINIQAEGYYEGGEMQLWEATGSRMIPLLSSFLYICFSVYMCSTSIAFLEDSSFKSMCK